jgi:putative hydrolase of the HAD superfamily
VSIRGIIFDLGWTLLDFAGDIPTVEVERARDLGAFLRGEGYFLDGADVYASYRREMRVLWETGSTLNYEYPARLAMLRALRQFINRDDAARFARGALTTSFDSLVSRWQPYPDTFRTLHALRDAGFRIGCISNTNDGEHVWRMVDRFGLRAWLSPIYTSEEFGLRKPHPRLFQTLLDDWGMSPEEVIMVGDTLDADVLGAHNAGMRGIWIDRGPANPWSKNEEARSYIVPDATIEQLAQLRQLLSGEWGSV